MSVVTGDVTMRLDSAIGNMIRRARAGGADTYAVLTELTRSAVRDWPAIHHGGITVVEDGDVVRSIAATDGHVLVVDNIARRQLAGPGIDAALDERRYQVDDLRTEGRWPLFAEKVAASTPIRSVIAIPIDTGGAVRAALNFYSDLPDTFGAEIEAVAAVYAEHVGRLLTTRRGRRRVPASTTADVVDQGKTLLMRRFGVDPAAALTVLLRLSKECNQSLEEIAHRLIGPRPMAEPQPTVDLPDADGPGLITEAAA
ncbi:GAF and ANTAR domain-containing protein [Mycolicibacterium thermoresistibile]